MMATTYIYGMESMQIAQRCYLAGIAIWHIVCFCIGVLAVYSIAAAKGKFGKLLLATMSLFVTTVFVAIAEYVQMLCSRLAAELFGKSFLCDELGRWAYPSWSPIAAVVAGAILIIRRRCYSVIVESGRSLVIAKTSQQMPVKPVSFWELSLSFVVLMICFFGPAIAFAFVGFTDTAIWQTCNLFIGVMVVHSIMSANDKFSKWMIAIASLAVVTTVMAIPIEGQLACALAVKKIPGMADFQWIYQFYAVWPPVMAMFVGAAVSFAIIMIRRQRERRANQSSSF